MSFKLCESHIVSFSFKSSLYRLGGYHRDWERTFPVLILDCGTEEGGKKYRFALKTWAAWLPV